jgi:hypothetical protein
MTGVASAVAVLAVSLDLVILLVMVVEPVLVVVVVVLVVVLAGVGRSGFSGMPANSASITVGSSRSVEKKKRLSCTP